MDKEQIEERRNKVAAAFAEAEGALKLAERVSGDVALPAVNQLRYALCHLLEDDFEAAIRHCVRARYDAYEASIGYFLDYIATFFEQDYPVSLLDRYLQNWKEYRTVFIEARTVLCEIRKLRDADEDEFKCIEEVVTRLAEVRDGIDAAYIEMRNAVHEQEEKEREARQQEMQDREDAKAREDRRRYSLSLWWTICGTILGALGILVAFLK